MASHRAPGARPVVTFSTVWYAIVYAVHQRDSGNWQLNVILDDEETVEKFKTVKEEMSWSDSRTAAEMIERGIGTDPRVQAVLDDESDGVEADD